MLWDPVLGVVLLSPSLITHVAMAKGGSGENTYITMALGRCSQAVSLKLQSK
jgi:hypothetical protein